MHFNWKYKQNNQHMINIRDTAMLFKYIILQTFDDMNNFLQSTFLVWFVLWKIRHLAAESGSCSVLSTGGSSCFILLDEINLEPVFFLFWRRLLVEMTPRGVCIIKTVSGFGALQKTIEMIKDEMLNTRFRLRTISDKTIYEQLQKDNSWGKKQTIQRKW